MTTPRDNRGPWTTLELELLRKHGHEGVRACAERLGRSPGAVRQAAARARISLRRTGSRSGLILNQPRGVSLRADLRADLVGRRRDELVAERLRLDAEALLCPDCGYRKVRVRATGKCVTCHTRDLVRAHEEITSDADACRELWAARQRRRAKLDELDAAAASSTERQKVSA